MTVSWPHVISNCVMLNYRVNYTGNVLWSNYNTYDTQDSTVTYVDLTDLTPWTSYTVCVAGLVVRNVVGASNCCSSTTPQAVPGMPAQFNQTFSSIKSVTVSWVQPEELNGELTAYQLAWPGHFTNLTANSTTYTISGLRPHSHYDVTLKASTAAGWGDAVRIQVKTEMGGNTGVIVGGLVGGLALMAVLVVATVFEDELKKKMKTVIPKQWYSYKFHTPFSDSPFRRVYRRRTPDTTKTTTVTEAYNEDAMENQLQEDIQNLEKEIQQEAEKDDLSSCKAEILESDVDQPTKDVNARPRESDAGYENFIFDDDDPHYIILH
nr:ephrin type-B receptor 1-like [Cherax quadricarinatus]